MYEQVFENFRKMAETGLQMQQDLFRQWTSAMTGPAVSQGAYVQQRSKLIKDWSAGVTELMNKHRVMLDSQYQQGIKAFEDGFKVADAKDPVEFRQKCEEYFRRSFDVVKDAFDNHVQQSKACVEKAMELSAKALP